LEKNAVNEIAETTQATADASGKKKRTLIGKVISNKCNKTITVLIERQVKHERYKKYVRRSTKIHAHDADNRCEIGDTVAIYEGRPVSKTKAWYLAAILERNNQVLTPTEALEQNL
jgi:small subunit ribosomal protein S17